MSRPLDWTFSRPVVYIDCGARGDHRKPLLKAFTNARYFGFEPDAEECERLRRAAPPGYEYVAVAAGARAERRRLHVTANPACSSLLPPNPDVISRFSRFDEFFAVTGHADVEVVAIDELLTARGIDRLDVLEVDAQGFELEILQGGEQLLTSTGIAVFCEVEFAPIYKGQPLFADIDAFLRQRGFVLFDLDRYYVRRREWTAETRGQLLWGQTVYLKDARLLEDIERRETLAAMASLLGFSDYAAEIVDGLLATAVANPEAVKRYSRARRELERRAQDRAANRFARWNRGWLGAPLRAAAARAADIADIYARATRRRNYVWKD